MVHTDLQAEAAQLSPGASEVHLLALQLFSPPPTHPHPLRAPPLVPSPPIQLSVRALQRRDDPLQGLPVGDAI